MPKLVYEGSVKNLWEVDHDKLEFEYSDAYSVFDWGRMPDALSKKGESLAALGAYFFQKMAVGSSWRAVRQSQALGAFGRDLGEVLDSELKVLERDGLKHHFLERSGPNRLLVRRVAAVAPRKHSLGLHSLYHYKDLNYWQSPARLIPLELIFRFGMPKGSSLVERLTESYSRQLGFSSIPREGEKFKTPILEFFSKLEDTDRFLTWEQALNYSGLEFEPFKKLVARTLLLSIWLSQEFESKGLELWDGKFEWALVGGELVLVDSIGPDELRLLDPKTGTQISKEFLRLFYRGTEWFEATKQAKKEAALNPSLDWKELVVKRAGQPPKLSREFREAADILYPSLVAAFTQENPGGLAIALPQMLERIRQCQR